MSRQRRTRCGGCPLQTQPDAEPVKRRQRSEYAGEPSALLAPSSQHPDPQTPHPNATGTAVDCHAGFANSVRFPAYSRPSCSSGPSPWPRLAALLWQALQPVHPVPGTSPRPQPVQPQRLPRPQTSTAPRCRIGPSASRSPPRWTPPSTRSQLAASGPPPRLRSPLAMTESQPTAARSVTLRPRHRDRPVPPPDLPERLQGSRKPRPPTAPSRPAS